jgi:hypothetical protein
LNNVRGKVLSEEAEGYKMTLIDLKKRQKDLGLEEKPPREVIQIGIGMGREGKPEGAFLPVYSKEECGESGERMAKTLFNLDSLLGFNPNRYSKRMRR